MTERNQAAGKREFGQYFTVANPFGHPLFSRWMSILRSSEPDGQILEPFAGANNIPSLMEESGFHAKWKCFDIEPSRVSSFPSVTVEKRDTISDFPQGFSACVTNPPYLGKSSAARRNIPYPWKEDDLYKVCLSRMLSSCGFVAAIIPESFVSSREFRERLWGVVSLPCRMFDDTECPVCLAMFVPEGSHGHTEIYSNLVRLGTLEELETAFPMHTLSHSPWKFNDPCGSVGIVAIDGQKEGKCRFVPGNTFSPSSIKESNRSFTRVSGLAENVDTDTFVEKCNVVLAGFREKTSDVMLTPFKGMAADGKFRRRLDWKTARNIMDTALVEMNGLPDAERLF